jgi:hypothetical protein
MNQKLKFLIVLLGLINIFGYSAVAEPRMPGSYKGKIIYDRWDVCILYSGVYLTYVSEKIKEDFRPYEGKELVINATKVVQPMNPGDARIEDYSSIEEVHGKPNPMALRIISGVEPGANGEPYATVIIQNTGKSKITLRMQDFAFTLLKKFEERIPSLSPSDGPSFALITRQGFWTPFGSRYESSGITNAVSYSWVIEEENSLSEYLHLSGNGKKRINIRMNLVDGEYNLLYGCSTYDSETTVVSNITSFNIEGGKLVRIVEEQAK